MSVQRFAVVAALSLAAGCTLYDDTGNPDPGQYWTFVCPDSSNGDDTPLPASTPIDYLAFGSCGPGGQFTLSVDGCEMIGNWTVLGLLDVETTEYTSTPGLGGWSITALGASGLWSCGAIRAGSTGLTFTCGDASSSAITCISTLTP